jgi:hypothetical protein
LPELILQQFHHADGEVNAVFAAARAALASASSVALACGVCALSALILQSLLLALQ